MKDEIIVKLTLIVICLVILFICWLGDGTAWNGGHCSCGGNWVYKEAVGHRYTTDYIYECDSCGRMHEFMEKR